MLRLAPLSDEEFPPESERVRSEIERKYGAVPPHHRVLAHAPAVLEATFALEQAVQDNLPPRYRELALLKVSRLNGCTYGAGRHARIAESVGLTDSQFEALDEFEESDAFDDREKSVLRFAQQLTRETLVSQATAEELAEFLDESQRVLLAAAVGLANFEDRLVRALGIDPSADEED